MSLTINSRSVRLWLHSANGESTSAERLLAMWNRRKDGPEREALWNGFWALKVRADEAVEALRKCGGLLHFGCARVERTDDGEYRLIGGRA